MPCLKNSGCSLPLGQRGKLFLQHLNGYPHGADHGVNNLASLEEGNRWERLDVERAREFLLAVDVNLAHLRASLGLRGHRIYEGANHLTRSTPFCPEIDKNRKVGLQDFFIKVVAGKLQSHLDYKIFVFS